MEYTHTIIPYVGVCMFVNLVSRIAITVYTSQSCHSTWVNVCESFEGFITGKKAYHTLKKKKKSVTGPALTVIRGLLICTFDYRYRSFEPSVHSFLDLLWKPCSIIHNWKKKFWSGRDGVTLYETEEIILAAVWPLHSCYRLFFIIHAMDSHMRPHNLWSLQSTSSPVSLSS